MKSIPQKKSELLARERNWPLLFAQGYVDGQTLRRRGKALSKYQAVAIGEYGDGIRAGFFGRRPDAMRGTGRAGASHE